MNPVDAAERVAKMTPERRHIWEDVQMLRAFLSEVVDPGLRNIEAGLFMATELAAQGCEVDHDAPVHALDYLDKFAMEIKRLRHEYIRRTAQRSAGGR